MRAHYRALHPEMIETDFKDIGMRRSAGRPHSSVPREKGCDATRSYWRHYKRQRMLGVWVEQSVAEGNMEDPGELFYVKRDKDGNWVKALQGKGMLTGTRRIMTRDEFDCIKDPDDLVKITNAPRLGEARGRWHVWHDRHDAAFAPKRIVPRARLAELIAEDEVRLKEEAKVAQDAKDEALNLARDKLAEIHRLDIDMLKHREVLLRRQTLQTQTPPPSPSQPQIAPAEAV